MSVGPPPSKCLGILLGSVFFLFLSRKGPKQSTNQIRHYTYTMASLKTSVVQRVVNRYYEGSLLRKGKKAQRKFELLSKLEKREWREVLQRRLSQMRVTSGVRTAVRAFSVKPKGKNKWKLDRISRGEQSLLSVVDGFVGKDHVEYQGGMDTVVKVAIAAAGFAAAKCAHTASRTITKAEEGSEKLLKQFTKQFEDFVESLKKLGGWLFKFVLAAVGSWFLFKYAAAPLICTVIQGFINRYVPMAKGLMGVSKQAFNDVSSLAALLCCLIVPTMSGSAGKIASNFMRTVSVFPKFSEGLASFMDSVMEYVETFVNWIMRREGEDRWTFGRKKDLTAQWRVTVLELCKRVDTHAHVPMELVHEMRDKVKEGYGLLQLMAHKESKDEIARWIDKLNSRLAPHLGSLSAENNMRPMPYLAVLGGASGIGKTSVVQVFASMVLALSGEVPADQVLQNLWQKGLSEYWNGYVGQRAIIKDDCFQVRGVAGAQDSEAMEIIRGIGNWACPLNFADLSMKGRVYLDVALMVGTTNAMNIKADWEPFITCPDALVRRFQGSYWLELNPFYANAEGRYDFYKIAEIYGRNLKEFTERRRTSPEWKPTEDEVLDIFPWDAWIVKQHGFDNSNPENGRILPGGMKEAVKVAASTIRMRKVEHARTVENITNHVKLATDAFAGLDFSDSGVSHQAGGPYMVHPGVRVTTSHNIWEENKDKVPDGNGWAQNFVQVTGKMSLDEEGEPILLDLERVQEQWFEKAIRTIKEWFSTLNKCVYGLTEKIGMPHKEVVDGVERYNADVYFVDTMIWTVGISMAFRAVKLIVQLLWTGVSAIFSLFGVTSKQSNNPPAKEKGLPKFEFPRVELQMGDTELQVGASPDDAVHEIVYRNMYMIGVRKDGLYTQIGNILCLGQQIFVMPSHFDEYVNANLGTSDEARVEIRHCTSQVQVSIDRGIFNSFPRARFGAGTDLVGLRMDTHVNLRSHRNIVPYFLTEDNMSTLLRGTKVATRLDVGRCVGNGDNTSHVVMSSGVLEYTPSVSANDGSTLKSLLRYEMPTKGGDCGGALMLEQNRHFGGRCLIGLHVAGKADVFTRSGYAAIVTHEAVREIWLALWGEDTSKHSVNDIVAPVRGEDLVQLEAKLMEQGIIGGSISYLGPALEPVAIASKSAIKRSPMHDDEPFGPSPVAPAKLRPTIVDEEVVYPMARAVEAYKSDVIVRDPTSLVIAAEVAFKPLFTVTEGMCAEVLTFEEAAGAVPEGMKLKALNRKTSPGYKYKKYVTPSMPGKTYWLGKQGDVDFSSPAMKDLRADVERIVRSAKIGVRELHVCTDFLKDELRPLDKVENVKTRMISGTELDYTIAVRMYFGSFCAAMLANPVVSGMAPGINHYTQWGVLATKLLSKGGKVFDGDFSRFDASEQPWVHSAILDVIQQWYRRSPTWSPMDEDVRSVLWDDLIHSIHITGAGCMADHIVQWHKSLPSGHPLTTVVNSMYSLLTLTACYIHLTGDSHNMWSHVFINTFGDDNVSGVDGEMCEKFNQVTVAHAMWDLFGLTYTAGAKDGELVPYTSIDKITFLKRSFVRDDDGVTAVIGGAPCLEWVGPLSVSSFLYTPYFYKNNKSPLLDVQANCEILQCELSLHSQDTWDEHNTKLETWAKNRGVPLEFKTRAAARAHTKTRFDVWF